LKIKRDKINSNRLIDILNKNSKVNLILLFIFLKFEKYFIIICKNLLKLNLPEVKSKPINVEILNNTQYNQSIGLVAYFLLLENMVKNFF